MYTASTLVSLLAPILPTLRLQDARLRHPIYTTADLRGAGLSRDAVRAAMRVGLIRRVRKGSYLAAGTPESIVAAAGLGARTACLSVLAPLGIFVLAAPGVHLHFERCRPARAAAKRSAVWHWSPLLRQPHPRATSVDLIDALAQSTVCQPPRAAVATLDSALHLNLITIDDLDEVFSRTPARRRALRRFVDGRSESGPESIVRMIALMLGFDVQVQVSMAGIGRVDLLLDGWLVVECDSEAFHSGWESEKHDRRRDLMLAARGFTSLRPIAEDIMYNPEAVVDALRGLRDARRPAKAVQS